MHRLRDVEVRRGAVQFTPAAGMELLAAGTCRSTASRALSALRDESPAAGAGGVELAFQQMRTARLTFRHASAGGPEERAER